MNLKPRVRMPRTRHQALSLVALKHVLRRKEKSDAAAPAEPRPEAPEKS